MATLELEDPTTGRIIYVDEATGQEVAAPRMVPPVPVVTPVPPLRSMGPDATPTEPEMSGAELTKAALMGPLQGVTFGFLPELAGLVDPATGQEMEQLYGRFQRQYPISSGVLEMVGPGALAGASRQAARKIGAPIIEQVVGSLASQNLIPQVLKGGLTGIGSSEGSLEERLSSGAVSAGLGGAGTIVGGLGGKALGTGRQMAQIATEPLTDAEKRLALNIAEQGQGEQFVQRAREAAGNLSPVETFGEMAGYAPAVQAISRMPEGGDVYAALERRAQTRPERLQSTFAEGLGGEGKIPSELAQEALQTSKDVRQTALQRQYQAGRELYTPLEVAPELTSGQPVTMGQAVSGTKLAKEELKYGKIIGKGEERIQNILDDVADDLGDDVANSILEPGISTAERTKRIRNISKQGYENADILMEEFGKVDQAQWNIIAKNRLRKEVDKLTSELKPRDWRKLLSHVYMGQEVPTLQNLPLNELKTKVLGTLKKVNAENARKDIGAWKNIDVVALNRLERTLEKGFSRIFPAIKEADYTYATKVIPEAFGGMEATARDALERMTRFDVRKPNQVSRIGKIISQLDPKEVQQIVEGAKNIGKPEMLDAMKKGYVGMLKKDVATQAPSKVIRYFDTSSNQRQILDILAGKEQSNKILSRLSKEEKLARVEGQVKGGSQTGPMSMALKDLTRMTDQPLPQNLTQRGLNMFRQPIMALDALISLAPQFRDKQVKNEIYRIYGLQGQTALQKMQQLAPIIQKLEASGELRDRWMEYGARLGAKIGTKSAQQFKINTEERSDQ